MEQGQGLERQPTPEEIGRERLALIGMAGYADRPAFWGGEPVVAEDGQQARIATFLGTYNKNGVQQMFEAIQSPGTPDSVREVNKGILTNAVRFAANEEIQS